jgi:hypothetical protein
MSSVFLKLDNISLKLLNYPCTTSKNSWISGTLFLSCLNHFPSLRDETWAWDEEVYTGNS